MKNVTFHPFPKPGADIERCRLWIRQCGRPHSDLSVDMIRPHHFVCSKVSGFGVCSAHLLQSIYMDLINLAHIGRPINEKKEVVTHM